MSLVHKVFMWDLKDPTNYSKRAGQMEFQVLWSGLSFYMGHLSLPSTIINGVTSSLDKVTPRPSPENPRIDLFSSSKAMILAVMNSIFAIA